MYLNVDAVSLRYHNPYQWAPLQISKTFVIFLCNVLCLHAIEHTLVKFSTCFMIYMPSLRLIILLYICGRGGNFLIPHDSIKNRFMSIYFKLKKIFDFWNLWIARRLNLFFPPPLICGGQSLMVILDIFQLWAVVFVSILLNHGPGKNKEICFTLV